MLANVLLVAATISVPPASAADPNDDDCANESNPDPRVGYCTNVIRSGRYAGANAAWAFANRCWAYDKKREYDHALQECEAAIRLKPDDADAFVSQCWA